MVSTAHDQLTPIFKTMKTLPLIVTNVIGQTAIALPANKKFAQINQTIDTITILRKTVLSTDVTQIMLSPDHAVDLIRMSTTDLTKCYHGSKKYNRISMKVKCVVLIKFS